MSKLIASIILLFALVLVHQRAAAQICYSYDGLGRLIGVIDQQRQAGR